jgi:NAD(P)-dependent dehydrogenase (short-subunit alcohol dehydrogenase family)
MNVHSGKDDSKEREMTDNQSKSVLITGCSTGIGRATAKRLAAAGHRVYASARRIDSIRDLAEAGCNLLSLDVCDESSIRAAVEEVERKEGAIGVLVNNAGYGSEGPFEEVPMEEVRRQFETNVFGLIRLTQLVLPGMRRQKWGRVLNLSSMGGRLTLPGGAFYHATKYAVEAMSDALRFEVRGFGIDVVVIEPGAIRTEFGDTAIARVDALGRSDSPYNEFRSVLKERIRGAYEGPMGKLAGEPDDVARVIETAIQARNPRTRYVITFGARFLMGLRRTLPDRAFDAFLRTQFKQPVTG